MSVSLDVDLDDIYSSLDRFDRIELLEYMQKDGYISKLCKISKDGVLEAPLNLERAALVESEDEFNKSLQTMFNQAWRMSNDDIDAIMRISEKYAI